MLEVGGHYGVLQIHGKMGYSVCVFVHVCERETDRRVLKFKIVRNGKSYRKKYVALLIKKYIFVNYKFIGLL